MSRQIIDIGVEGNDGTGDSIRESFRKSNENFRELYAVFGQGGQINFTDLGDTPSELTSVDANKIVAVNNTGSALAFKTLVNGRGITITSTDNTLTISNTGATLADDPTPSLAYHLNASDQMIGYIRNPESNLIQEFNFAHGTNLNLDGRDFAVNKGYIENTFVHLAGDTMTGPLNVPAGATGTQVPRVNEVVKRSGDTMTGALHLNDHPEAWDKVTPPDNTDYRAVSKYYVDNVNSEINTSIEEAGFASKDYVDAITGAMFEPTGFNRYEPLSMGTFEFTIDGLTIYKLDHLGNGTTRNDGKFATGTVWERAAGTKSAVYYPAAGQTSFTVWQGGQKYVIETLLSTTYNLTNGSHFFFINNGNLEHYMAIGSDFLQKRPFMALVYCNEATNQVLVLGEERHGITMDGTTHYYLHTTVGTRYRSGLGVAGIAAGSSTYTGTASGIMYDEDIIINVPSQMSNRHFYLSGASWAFQAESTNIAPMVSGTAYYNRQLSVGNYDLAPVPAGNYFIVYFIATNCSLSHTVKIPGQRLFSNIAEASNIAQTEPRELVFLGLPVAEFLYVGCVVVNHLGQVQTLEGGSTYVDLRQININAGINLTAAVQVTASDVFFDRTQTGFSAFDIQSAFNEAFAPNNYLDKRLGLTKTNALVGQSNLIGPGYLDRNGLLSFYGGSSDPALKNPLNMSEARISNLGSPTSDTDAVNKLYVDSQQLSNLSVDTTTSPAKANNDLLVYNGSKWVNAANSASSDISLSLNTKTLTLSIKSGVIVNADVNDAAAIDQTKLNLTNAYATGAVSISNASATRSNSTATLTFADQGVAPFNTGQRITVSGFVTTGYNGTFTVLSSTKTTVTYTVDSGLVTPALGTGTITSLNGVASFDNTKFTANNGWISLADSSSTSTGVKLSNIQYIGGTAILGRRDGVSGPPTELSASNIVTDGDGIKNALFTSSGAMTVTSGTPNAYGVTAISTAGAVNSLVKTNANGRIALSSGANGGLAFPNDAFGGSGDTATITLQNPAGGEATRMTFTMTNDNDDTIGFVVPSNNGVLINGNTVWHAGNDGAGSGLDADTLDGYNLDATAAVNTVVRRDASGNIYGVTGSFSTSVITPLLTTGSSATAGVVTGNWTLSSGSKFQATYADLAEYYEGDCEYEPGTVVVFGGTREVTLSTTLSDRRVAGVVTTDPAYVMNADCPGIKVCVALQGRVPVKVIGKVAKGDVLITSARPGYAEISNDPKVGTVIGKALQNKDTVEEGVIEVAIGRL